MVCIITSPERIHEEEKQINALMQAGAERIILRKPGWTDNQYRQLVEAIDPAFFNRLFIRDCWHICTSHRLGGIHLSGSRRAAMLPVELQQCLQECAQSSTGIHHLSGIDTTARQFNTLLLSPVFDSISKPGYRGNFAQPLLHKDRHRILALGGVNHTNISRIKQWGYGGAAVLGAIWQQPEKAVENYYHLQQLWKKTDPL